MTPNRLASIFTVFVFTTLLGACGGESSENNQPPEPPPIGWMQSSDTDTLNIDTHLYGYLHLDCPDPSFDTVVTFKPTPGSDLFPLSSDWTLNMRGLPVPDGSYMHDDLTFRLAGDYFYETLRADCLSDEAQQSWLAVGGYANVENHTVEGGGHSYVAYMDFQLHFQQETALRSGVTEGPIISVAGCWHLPSSKEVDNRCLPRP